MNIQAMMKQAQQLQKDMILAKKEIDNQLYEAKKSFLEIKMNGKREIVEVRIEREKIDKEDIEVLEDLILLVIKDLNNKIDKDTNEKLGKYTKGMPGIF
jgi:nucleoid-associated protein EbfC